MVTVVVKRMKNRSGEDVLVYYFMWDFVYDSFADYIEKTGNDSLLELFSFARLVEHFPEDDSDLRACHLATSLLIEYFKKKENKEKFLKEIKKKRRLVVLYGI